MEPRIQYARTTDGVNIGYWTLGTGTPFILMPSSMLSPSIRHWATDRGRRWFSRVAENRMLIRYDNRGCGIRATTSLTTRGDQGFQRCLKGPVSFGSGGSV